MQFKKYISFLFILLCLAFFCFGCDAKPETGTPAPTPAGDKTPAADIPSDNPDETQPAGNAPPRDNTPRILNPEPGGSEVYGDNVVQVDASNSSLGYVLVQYNGVAEKTRLFVTTPLGNKYSYMLGSGFYETIPLTEGDGEYQFVVMEHVEGNQYATLLTQAISVAEQDDFTAFLYSNQFVSFSSESEAVKKGQALAADTYSDLDVVKNVYHYVIKNITYDKKKAESALSGTLFDFLPNVDETLASGKGICFDYAALMSAMLRSQGIPTKLQIGYAGEVYHAWISTYVDEVGWIDNIIQFDGQSWQLMDPTFAAGSGGRDTAKYIGEGTNYTTKYSY